MKHYHAKLSACCTRFMNRPETVLLASVVYAMHNSMHYSNHVSQECALHTIRLCQVSRISTHKKVKNLKHGIADCLVFSVMSESSYSPGPIA